LLEGSTGHNLAEAAVAGCAVLVGEHAGHFNQMADELNQAAVMAAEEAAAAVNSSGPLMEEAFSYNVEQPAAANGAGASANSPRDRGGPGHWRGVLDDHPRASGAGNGAALGDAASASDPSSRPATAPAAVAYSRERRYPFARGQGVGMHGRGGRDGSGSQGASSSQSLHMMGARDEDGSPSHPGNYLSGPLHLRMNRETYESREGEQEDGPARHLNTVIYKFWHQS
jgi:hypothetical protein